MLTNSNFYIGDSSVSRLYQGDNLIWDASRPDILLSYIANGPDDSSTAQRNVYFDTDVNPTGLTTAEVKYQVVSTSSAQEMIFGVNYNNKYYHLLKDTYGNALFWYINRIGGIEAGVRPSGYADTNIHTIRTQYSSSNINLSYDSSSYQGGKSSYTDPGTTAYLSIFARNKGTSHDLYAYGGMKIYYLKFWEDNNLVRFYIPVLHYINGQYTPCFYDKVNDTYIYNLGTDSPTYKISGDYLLDYLGAQPETEIPNTTGYTGFQFDTGVVASNALSVDIKGRLVWGFENNLFASATDNVSTPTWKTFGFTTSGGSTDADKCRLVFQWGAHNSGTVRTFISMDSSALVEPHKISMFFDASRGNGYLDGSLYTSLYDTWDFSPNTMYLLNRHNNSVTTTAGAGARCYYANYTISNVPTKTYVPVLHNNQAAFLDLNSGTYIYNMGTQIPYYELNR